ANHVASLRRVRLHDPAALEAQLEVANLHAEQLERTRGADAALGAPPIGRGEDLFGREIGHVLLPPGGGEHAADPASALREPNGEVGARAAEAQGVEAALVEQCAAPPEPCDVLLPC